MKHLSSLLFVGALLLAQHVRAQVITPTTHKAIVTWTWSQAPNTPPAAQFNIMRANVSGGCAQIPAVPPATVNTFPAGCTQIGVTAPGQLTYTDQANPTTNLLIEGQTYCWVIVTQQANGQISVDGYTGPVGTGAQEVCKTIPFVGSPSAPAGEVVVVQ